MSKQCVGKVTGTPLHSYPSQCEAEEASVYVFNKHNKQMKPYKCSHCGTWHLAPLNRHTPSDTCSFCLDSNGRAKELYRTEHDALRRAEILLDERGVRLRVYECPHQAGWHLTSRVGYGEW